MHSSTLTVGLLLASASLSFGLPADSNDVSINPTHAVLESFPLLARDPAAPTEPLRCGKNHGNKHCDVIQPFGQLCCSSAVSHPIYSRDHAADYTRTTVETRKLIVAKAARRNMGKPSNITLVLSRADLLDTVQERNTASPTAVVLTTEAVNAQTTSAALTKDTV